MIRSNRLHNERNLFQNERIGIADHNCILYYIVIGVDTESSREQSMMGEKPCISKILMILTERFFSC